MGNTNNVGNVIEKALHEGRQSERVAPLAKSYPTSRNEATAEKKRCSSIAALFSVPHHGPSQNVCIVFAASRCKQYNRRKHVEVTPRNAG